MTKESLLNDVLTFDRLRGRIPRTEVGDNQLKAVVGRVRRVVKGLRTAPRGERFYPEQDSVRVEATVAAFDAGNEDLHRPGFAEFRPLSEQEKEALKRKIQRGTLVMPSSLQAKPYGLRVSYCFNDPFVTCVVMDKDERVRMVGTAKRSIYDKPNAGGALVAFKRALEQGWIKYPKGRK